RDDEGFREGRPAGDRRDLDRVDGPHRPLGARLSRSLMDSRMPWPGRGTYDGLYDRPRSDVAPPREVRLHPTAECPDRVPRGTAGGLRATGGPGRGLSGRPLADRIRPNDLGTLDDRDHARGSVPRTGRAGPRDRD